GGADILKLIDENPIDIMRLGRAHHTALNLALDGPARRLQNRRPIKKTCFPQSALIGKDYLHGISGERASVPGIFHYILQAKAPGPQESDRRDQSLSAHGFHII